MEIGLRDSEAVIRLSADDKPIVLQGLEKQESAMWIRIARNDKMLSQLLVGKKRYALDKSAIFDKITDSHRLALAKLRQAALTATSAERHLLSQLSRVCPHPSGVACTPAGVQFFGVQELTIEGWF